MQAKTYPDSGQEAELLEVTDEDRAVMVGMSRVERRRYLATRRLEARRERPGWGKRPRRPRKPTPPSAPLGPGVFGALGFAPAAAYTAALPVTPDGERLRLAAEAAFDNALAEVNKGAVGKSLAHVSIFDLHEGARRLRRRRAA